MSSIPETEMYQRIALISKTIVRHPKYEEAVNTIEEVFRMRNSVGICNHLFCIGPSGTGKSTIKKQLREKYPAVVCDDRTCRPYICSDTPSKPTIGNMAEELLMELGEPNYSRGSVAQKTNRVLALLKQLDVKLVVLDELQHFIDHGNKRTATEVSDWLKRLVDNSNTCFVLMGLERAGEILRANEQLRRRFSQQVILMPFSIDKKVEAGVFARVFQHLDMQLGLEQPIELTPNLVKQLHFATNGIMDYMVKLIIGAFQLSKLNQQNKISVDVLEAAFTKCIWTEGIGKLNPFNAKFCWLRLTKPGMPFYRVSDTAAYSTAK